jgi:hypothetical protein
MAAPPQWREDSFLRENGWTVESRPLKGPAIWRHKGKRLSLTTEQAIAHCCKELGIRVPKREEVIP